MRTTLLIVAVIAMMGSAAKAQVKFHVSPAGSDANPGTRSRPFATLARARDAVRQAKDKPHRAVILHAGRYELNATLQLDAANSGSAAAPILWQAAAGESVHIVGGHTLPASAFRSVVSADILARLDPTAAKHALVADLGHIGTKAAAQFPVHYHGAPPGPELFFNDQRMEIAHWPNRGWTTINKILDAGSLPREGDKSNRPGTFTYNGGRPAHWREADGIWLQGYWCFDWYDEVIRVGAIDRKAHRITLAAPHVYSLRQGNPSPRRYRALNLLEELDQPGEFYIDRQSSRLYFWPPAQISTARVTLSTLDAPLIALHNVSNVTLRGLTVEDGLGNGIEVEGGANCVMEACEIRNMRQMGVQVTGGLHHRVEACDIHDTGTGGLKIEGGDRKTLTPAGHQVLNNHIWRFSVHQQTSAHGLVLGGVGIRAAHNLIHDAPHRAVLINGNDHIFEYNEVHHVCTETDDCGALYKGRNPSCRGNIIRYNYWHDIGGPMGHGNAAIYFDDGDGGDTVFGNVFYRCGDPGRGSFGTVFSHGGHGILAQNNIFIECKRALGSAPWDEARWQDALNGGQDCFFPDKLLKEVDITKPPYTTRYPELIGYMNPPPGAKRVSTARLNLLVKCGQTSGGNWQFDKAENLVTDADPGFEKMEAANFRLSSNAAVFKKLEGFLPIPFSKIGLQRSKRGSKRVE